MNFYQKIFFSLLLTILNFSTQAQSTDIKSYMFGHSLMDHRPPLIPTPSDETTIAHWIYLLATDAGHTYSATGQYGFLPQHQNLPPDSQWGYDIVPNSWDASVETFAEADLNNVLITAGNFMQWQAPNLEYPTDPGISPISATQTIVDWLETNEPGIKIYIYENWPDMAPYIAGGSFPPSSAELTNYYNYLESDFHDWWLEYHDSILLSHPIENVRMIPVGPILSELLTNTVLNTIPATELYEDNAPHGRATLYFLASMVTYMAIYEEQTPANYTVPSIVHATVANNYSTIVSTIWNELLDFNLANGDSRVFFNNSPLPVSVIDYKVEEVNCSANIFWRTSDEINNSHFIIERSENGNSFQEIAIIEGKGNSNQTKEYRFKDDLLKNGIYYYRIHQIDLDGSTETLGVRAVDLNCNDFLDFEIFPNPTRGNLKIFFPNKIRAEKYVILNASGKIVLEKNVNGFLEGEEVNFDLHDLPNGIYYFKLFGEHINHIGKRFVKFD
ncbi:MAG: T9SS type A sorting domain-containing protein [Saprospiraceae bacterium]